jgi:alkylation response protein AidB-like acyl-CoA dehydrogenase
VKDFAAPTDDILFSLHHVADAGATGTHDASLASDVVNQYATFAEHIIAPTNRIGDRQGCRLENGRVRTPDGFADAFRQLAEGGWLSLTVPEEFGGMGLDRLTAAGVSEISTGANHALQMATGLVPGAVSTLLRFGTAEQQQQWIPRLADGRTLNTMCLTEAGAGSDLSRVRTTAERQADCWRLSGEKIFISNGDQDLSEDILHFVLARSGPAETGTRGLSLFLCPSRVENGRNDVGVARIEDKLGIHGSPTCQLVFDGAAAELIGEEGGGLAAMFTLMNHARVDVALQGVAHAARAHDIAASYASGRAQGRRPDGAPAMLSDHADVRQMLDEQRALAVGSRAMCHLALVVLEDPDQLPLADFLTPICKMFATEAGIRAADVGIQVLGGYGYLEEYDIAQTWRDARITSIYEGANGIHALTAATRGLRAHGGAGAEAFANFIRTLGPDAKPVLSCLAGWENERDETMAYDGVPPNARLFASLTAELFFRAAWSRIGRVAEGTAFEAEFTRLADLVLNSPMPLPRFRS